MKACVLGALLLLSPTMVAAQVTVTIQQPLAGAFVDDNARVIATVTSAYAIQSVTQSVMGRDVAMIFSTCAYTVGSGICQAGWAAHLPPGLPRGDLLITITARDVMDSVGVASRHVTFDRRPTLYIASPFQFAVARPLVHVVASCLDDDPAGCASISVSDCPTPTTFSTQTIGGSFLDVFVRPCNSGDLDVTVSATDYVGQQTFVRIPRMSIEPSPTLRSVATVNGLIVDARDSRVLYKHFPNPDNIDVSDMWVHDFVAGGPDKQIPPPPGYANPFNGGEFLTPHGVMFVSRNDSPFVTELFEWRDEALVDLGAYGAYLDHSDTYAAWVSDGVEQQHLVLRDLAAGTNTDTTVATRVVNLDVAVNGDVVFMSPTGFMGRYNILRYRGGVVSQLTGGSSFTFTDPRTDGINVTYVQGNTSSTSTMFFDGAEHLLTTPATGPGRLNNGWIAFTNRSGSATYQVVERAPDGTTTQLTFFDASSAPVALAANGEIAINTDASAAGTGGTYIAVPGMALRKVAATALQSYYLNGQWYFALGNTLFAELPTCDQTVSPASRSYGAAGGNGTFEVAANGDACPWTVSGVPSWVTIYIGASGAGSRTVRFGIAANPGAARTATLTIAGHVAAINQAAAGTLTHTRNDFTGSGHAGRSVYRPYGGTWFIEGLLPVTWGHPSFMPVPADYDGDGITDLGAFAPDTGTWFIRGGATTSWGSPGDIPVPADYDGNGRADVAVFRPALGRWFIKDQFTADWGLADDVPVPADYDGDGRAELAVYRPSTGTWYVRGVGSVGWGAPGDIPVPADYDGDGVVDIAVYRPSTGTWYVRNQFTRQYGLTADLPVPLDYDGDGRAELAVYRRSTGTWYVEGGGPGLRVGRPGDLPLGLPAWLIPHPAIDRDGDRRMDTAVYDTPSDQWLVQPSAYGFYSRDGFSFGAPTDVRRITDFDGDGRGDLAIMRPSTGMWYVALSATGYTAYVSYGPWGTSTDTIVPGDYDGDRRADLMFFRASEGRWYLKTSTSGYAGSLTIDWGLPGDIAVPADYDGDGRVDVAVFRPSTGRWYVKRSSDGSMAIVDWGVSSDIPVPADYDGDGRTDAAIFRPSTGEWWICYSSTNFTTYSTVVYGTSGDVPVPGDYNGDGLAEPAYFRPNVGFYVSGLGQLYTATSGGEVIR